MINPQRFDVLFKAFHRSKAEGLHYGICPPPASFASEILGLLARKNQLENKCQSKKIKDSSSQTLPPHIHSALQNVHMSPKKNGFPLDLNTQYHQYWSSDPRDIVFGAHYNSLSS
eukprot:1145144-Pelagomonas_calceolata.AAC.3